MRHTVMNDENRSSNILEPNARITRARAKALGSSGLPPLHPLKKKDDKQVSHANSKRALSDINKAAPQNKRRAVLKDVTNVTCEKLYLNCINATKAQPSKQDAKGFTQKKRRAGTAVFVKQPPIPVDKGGSIVEEIKRVEMEERKEICSTEDLTTKLTGFIRAEMSEDHEIHMKQETLEDRGIIDIDKKHEDPNLCTVYAADIYSILHAIQLDKRPLVDYMETLQKDITHGMRAILIDWLVEVSEEYNLVPDTLYLTVNLVDRFLSENFIEKQKLQLLGVTSMLIASKYEEICAPGVEDFCSITDNTYMKEEIVKMESRVLNCLRFQLSVPTTKKFLRRFVQAAQVSYENPLDELEFLANYLAELTLIDYNFLKFLPSLIAASVVFLTRWTLDQSEHPWNPTLEYYTRYKTSELKNTVIELQDLQLNTNGSMLKAIREKYKQSKLKCVSTLRAQKPVQSLFEA